MTHPEFATQMDRLRRRYGPNSFPIELADILFDAVGTLDARIFERVVTVLMGRLRQAPMLPDFEEAIVGFRKVMQAESKQRIEDWRASLKEFCWMCGNGGLVSAKPHDSPYQHESIGRVSFRCTCQVGLKFYANSTLPEWSEKRFGSTHEPQYWDTLEHDKRKAITVNQAIDSVFRPMPQDAR